ncbi:uncharacterized protein LOC123530808, partial [Mercenaria mercenaria]|uniref:uncharacterized protein LOC123530808 n=1 Tax=Mercenaria mercenaria TaxID=6596 RepID=UPI00234ED1A3
KIIASRLGRTFLDNTSLEENSGEGITTVKIKGGETVSETDIKYGSLVEQLDPVPTASADLVSIAPKETSEVETAAEGTTNEEECLDLQQPKRDRKQFEHYIKSHIDHDAFSWRIIEGVAEFVVLSLHVLFGTNRIKEIQNEGGDVENLKHLDVCCQLYQFLWECKCGVNLLYNGKKVGEAKRALYKQGEQGDYSAAVMDRSGFEIALVKMDHEEEVSIDFADSIADQWNKLGMGTQLVFKGRYKNYHDIPLDTEVYKMGPKTGLTKGKITKKNEPYKLLNGVLLLFNQVEVQWENVPFSEPGDSGSMVFSVEKEEMISIGIVTGGKREKKISIVTPISEIMEYIREKNKGKYYRLKQFMLKMDGRNLTKIITDKIKKRMLPRS